MDRRYVNSKMSTSGGRAVPEMRAFTAVHKALRRAGVPDSVIEAYAREAKSGDYDHLVETNARYVDFV